MIDRAKPADLPQIAAIWKEVSINEFSDYIGENNVKAFIESGELENECRKHLDSTFVVTKNKVVAGFVVILGNLIELLIVRPEHQNQFVGKRLYEFALFKIRENYSEVGVECFAKNLRANSILRRLGYRLDSTYQDEMGFTTNKLSKAL